MSNPDVIIIGTGVIGTATAFELAKAGYKTLSLDRNTQIGHGSTAGSCAIIRMRNSIPVSRISPSTGWRSRPVTSSPASAASST